MRLKIFSFLVLIFVTVPLFSQRDSSNTITPNILLNDKAVNRPVNLYKGQFQCNINYQFGVQSKKFDDAGNKLDFSQDGRATMRHYYCLNLKYGILKNLEFSTSLPYSQFIEREIPTVVFSSPYYYQLNTITENKGFYDLSFDLSYQLIHSKKFFMIINGGAFIPTAQYKPEQPQNEIINNPDFYHTTADNAVYVNYHNYNKLGDGIYKLQVGGAIKWIISNLAISCDANYIKGLGETNNISWQFQLNNGVFQYKENPYKMQYSDNLKFNGGLMLQVYPWLAVATNFQTFNAFNGWSEESGKRIRNPEMDLVNFVPGFEIQVTSHLRWTQEVGFPISGRNIYAPLYFSTGISLNYFPFKK